ncbi:MAG: type IV toxin-antitoxin system AbiEi family antitoxin domain-containing protein [Desulfopila sp.]
MTFNSPEIIEMLKQQRNFHEEQLRLIDIALRAIEAGLPAATESIAQKKKEANNLKKHHIPWTREIGSLLNEYDQFNIIDLQSDLAEKRGIATAMTIQGRNVISNTLSRFIKRGRIEKIRPGVYQVITESVSS